MHEVIVVGVDGSEAGVAAVVEGAELARRFNARLIALSVEEGFPRFAATIGEVDEFKGEKDLYFQQAGPRAMCRGRARCGASTRNGNRPCS